MKAKRLLTLVLTLFIAVQIMPASASAEDHSASVPTQEYQVSSQEQFGAAYYAVTFQYSDRNSQTQLVRSGTSISLPAAAAEDSSVRFDGWYTAEGFQAGKEGVSFTPLSDVTLIARYTTTSLTKSISSESNLGLLELTAPTGFLGLGQGGLPTGSEAEANWAAVGSGEEAALTAVPAGEGMTNRAIGAFMLSLSNEFWQQNSSVHAKISFNRSFELKEDETLALVRVSGGPQVIPCSFSGNPLSGAEFSDDALGTYVIVGTSAAAVELQADENQIIAEKDLTLRAEPNGLSEIVATVPTGTQIAVLSEEGNWTLVKLLNGTEGYVYTKDIDKTPVAEGEMKVTIFSDRRPVMNEGDTVTLTSSLEGFDGYELYYIWEVDKGYGFEEIPESNYPTYSFEATIDSLNWDWRLEVLYR